MLLLSKSNVIGNANYQMMYELGFTMKLQNKEQDTSNDIKFKLKICDLFRTSVKDNRFFSFMKKIIMKFNPLS
jgi:hypothetical protein